MSQRSSSEQPEPRIKELETELLEAKKSICSLQESERRLRLLFENSMDAFLLTSPDGSILDTNPAACRMFKRDVDDIRKVGRNGLVDLSDPRLHKALEERARTGRVHALITMVRSDNTKFEAEISSSIYLDENEFQRTSVIIRDINEQKEAEQALRESEERFRFLAERMADIIWTSDLSLKTTYVSPSIEKILGFTPEERKEQTLQEMATPESLRVIERLLTVEYESEKTGMMDPDRSLTIEVEYYHKNGGAVWFENTLKWIRDSGGNITGIIGVARDISERKKVESERKKLQQQLVHAQKMESMGRMAGGVAHDFNNMLSVIMGNAELALGKTASDDPLREELNEILDAARRSSDFTRQLLAFARRQIIVPRALDLNDTLEGMLKMLRRLIGEDIDLSWQPGAGLWPVNMDPSQIDQILANMCVNARDAIAGVGKITIKTDNVQFDAEYCSGHPDFRAGEFVLLEVSDDGRGMDMETIDNLFEPFFTTKGVGKGTGLGLATVYGIVTQNDGFINVQSYPGKGATFRIFIPRHEGESRETQTEVTSEIPMGHGETVLIVEDEASILKLAKRILERLGYRVLDAATPGQALALAREHTGRIDLLVTDVIMPEMNGRELAEKLQADYQGLKVLLMSGYTADVIAHRGVLDTGMIFIQKPFSNRDLGVKVREALGG